MQTAGAFLCFSMIMFSGCSFNRRQERAPGQPTMNELMHRRAASYREEQARHDALMRRARSLSSAGAVKLAADLKKHPQDENTFWTLVRHYEYRVNIKDLNALRLWYIEHQPDGKINPGNIDSRLDASAWRQGKALWLKHVNGCKVSADVIERAADFLDGGDKPLAEKVLQHCRGSFQPPGRWEHDLGRHYAQVLLGSVAPVTEYNVLRATSPQEAQTPYAQRVRASLTDSTDAAILESTAQYLLMWGSARPDSLSFAGTLVARALSIQPDSGRARAIKSYLTQAEQMRRQRELMRMTAAQRAALSNSDRMLLALSLMRNAPMNQSFDVQATARDLLALASSNPGDELYGDAVFEANIVLGKVALRAGDRKAAIRHLLAASGTPGSERLRRGEFDMNLPRAIVDSGEREAVAVFLERMSAKTKRAEQLQEWAGQIRKGINPDLLPTMGYPGCLHDPC